MQHKLARTRTRTGGARRAAALVSSLLLVGLGLVTFAGPSVADGDDGRGNPQQICDQSPFTYVKYDSPSGSGQPINHDGESIGTMSWGGGDITFDIDPGYTVDFCVKQANNPVWESGGNSGGGNISSPWDDMSHVGYKVVGVPTVNDVDVAASFVDNACVGGQYVPPSYEAGEYGGTVRSVTGLGDNGVADPGESLTVTYTPADDGHAIVGAGPDGSRSFTHTFPAQPDEQADCDPPEECPDDGSRTYGGSTPPDPCDPPDECDNLDGIQSEGFPCAKDPEKGKDWWTDEPDCTEGTVSQGYTPWTQEWVFVPEQGGEGRWELGDKTYGDPVVQHTRPATDEECPEECPEDEPQAPTAFSTGGADRDETDPCDPPKPPVCHPTNGNGNDGWVIIPPDEASSHIDEAIYPGDGYWKHESHDGRHDVYADEYGECPPNEDEDECENLAGVQPVGFECAKDPLRGTDPWQGQPNCTDRTVSSGYTPWTQAWVFVPDPEGGAGTWELGERDYGAAVVTDTRPATVEECPPPDPEPVSESVEGCDLSELGLEPGAWTRTGEREYVLVDNAWVLEDEADIAWSDWAGVAWTPQEITDNCAGEEPAAQVRTVTGERESCRLGGVETWTDVYTTGWVYDTENQVWVLGEETGPERTEEDFTAYTPDELEAKGCVDVAGEEEDEEGPGPGPGQQPVVEVMGEQASIPSAVDAGLGPVLTGPTSPDQGNPLWLLAVGGGLGLMGAAGLRRRTTTHR